MNGTPSIAGVPYKTNNLNTTKIPCKEQARNAINSPKITRTNKPQTKPQNRLQTYKGLKR
jgi:hypothetical protein